MASNTGYVHGTHPDEQRRLSRMNDFLNEGARRELRLAGGERILDVGSGLGQFTRLLAREAGNGAVVVGVERSEEQLASARSLAEAQGEVALVEFRSGNALALPLRADEWGRFDVAHTRFLLEHVPDPLAVVKQMVAAVRPGGRILLADDDHDVLRLWPEPPGLAPLWQAYMRSYDRAGNDPIVGRRLVSLLHAAGARPVRNTWVFFGDCAGGAHFDLLVDNLVGVLDGAREAVLAAHLDPALFEQGLGAVREWGRRPDAALWYAVAWAEGVKR
jgi:SAM-dependent methyltransferase